MSYKPLRKDLTEFTTKCHFCPKQLSSLKAYVLQNLETNEIVYAGPVCAKRNISNSYTLNNVPDFTKFTLPNGSNTGGSTGDKITTTQVVDLNKKAVEYLVLRENKLAKEFNCSYKILKNYYTKYVKENLDAKEIQHIINIERKSPHNLKLQTLQKCYNYLFWIDVAMSKLPIEKRTFLKSIRSYILKNRKLKEQQLKGLNNWLEFIKGVPQLK